MSEAEGFRIFTCAIFAGFVLLHFYVLNKDKRRYQPVIDPGMLLIYVAVLVPVFIPMATWMSDGEELLPQLACFLFVVFAHAILYYTVLLAVLPLLRRWFSPEAVAALWLLPNFLYLISQYTMKAPPPRLMWLAKPGFLSRLTVVWAIGAAVVLIYFVIQHLIFRQHLLRSAVPVTDTAVLEQWQSLQNAILFDKKPNLKLLTSPNVVTPLSIGLTRYTIRVVLPEKAYTPEERALIFRHELIHIARGDAVLKLTLTVCVALGWFNPLLWLAIKRCGQDTELACDCQVMEDCGQEQGQRYAGLILSSAGDERGFTTCLSADAIALRYRLRGIVSPEKKPRGGVMVALVLFLLLYFSNCFGLAWEAGTARELLFEQQPETSALFSVALSKSERRGMPYPSYTCTDEAALTGYLAGLELYRTGELYDYTGEDRLIVIYDRPDGLSFGLALGTRNVTLTYFGSKYRQVSYYLAQPVDWEQVFRWLEPQELEETWEETE